MELSTGRVTVMFETGKSASFAQLWQAIKDSGFTPVRVEIKDQVYEGPQSTATSAEGTE